MSLTIIIADDHPLMLSGNKQFLIERNFNVIDTAKDGNEAYNKIVKQLPDIAILDFDMPKLNGIEVSKSLKAKGVETKVVILTLHKQEVILNEIGKSINGYVLKEAALQEFEDCINLVSKGHNYISSKLRQDKFFLSEIGSFKSLTNTEVKILRYLEQEMTSSQVANELFISKRTVEKHRSNIIQKLGLDSNAHSLLLWVKKNLELIK